MFCFAWTTDYNFHGLSVLLPANTMPWQDALSTAFLYFPLALITKMLLDSHTLRATLVCEQQQFQHPIRSQISRSREDPWFLFRIVQSFAKFDRRLGKHCCQISCKIWKRYDDYITQWHNIDFVSWHIICWYWNRPMIPATKNVV